jgi:hypothetical protein
MVADYDLVRSASKLEATEVTAEARKFINACMNKWGFYDHITDELD